MKDAAGFWKCGAAGGNCTMKYNQEVFCGFKPAKQIDSL